MKLRTKRQIGRAAYLYLLDVVGYSTLQARATFRASHAWQIEELGYLYREWCHGA